MSLLKVYERIEDVLRVAGRPLAAHEIDDVDRRYIACTEASIARRMREMAAAGRLVAKTREGKTFKEYEIKRQGM